MRAAGQLDSCVWERFYRLSLFTLRYVFSCAVVTRRASFEVSFLCGPRRGRATTGRRHSLSRNKLNGRADWPPTDVVFIRHIDNRTDMNLY